MTTPAENAATVREALEDIAYRSPANNAQGNLNIAREKAVLSLPALAALKAQAETLRADLEQMEANMALVDGVAQAAEAERDRLREMCRLLAARVDAYPGEALLELFRRTEVITSERNRLHREIVRLTARVEELEAALREIERLAPGTHAEAIARAALATDKQP